MSVARERKSSRHVQENGASIQAKKELVQREAVARLRRSSYREVRGVTCEFHEGVLTLRGHLPSFYLKQVAQSLVDGIEGVEEINNRLEAEWYGRPKRK
jgi:osmotically-inducible protein OsmY